MMFIFSLQNQVSNLLKIVAVKHTGDHYTYDLPTTLEAYDFLLQ